MEKQRNLLAKGEVLSENRLKTMAASQFLNVMLVIQTRAARSSSKKDPFYWGEGRDLRRIVIQNFVPIPPHGCGVKR